MELVTTALDWLTENCFEDYDDASAYTYFDVEDEGDRVKFEIRCELGYDQMGELCMVLDPILIKYDPNAYFDFEDSGIISAFIEKPNVNVLESLKRIDRIHFNKYGESLDLTSLYEALPLTSQDKSKLSNFVKKTNDPEEIENYLVGLVSRKKNRDKKNFDTRE